MSRRAATPNTDSPTDRKCLSDLTGESAESPPRSTIRSPAGGQTEGSGWTKTDGQPRVTIAETASATELSRSGRKPYHGLPPSRARKCFLAHSIDPYHGLGGEPPGGLHLRPARR